MSTVNDVYLRVCETLLEPNGFTLGLISEANFLEYFSATMQHFLATTGIVRCIAVMPQSFGTPQYTLPDFLGEPDACFSDGSAIRQDAEGNLSSIAKRWQSEIGTPRSWRQDKQLPNQVSLYPAPNVENPAAPAIPPPGVYGAVLAWAPGQANTGVPAYIGTVIQSGGSATFTTPGTFFGSVPLYNFSRGNVCVIGPLGLMTQAISLSSPIESLTDDWLTYIQYGILEKVWMSDSELKDTQRARYAHARYEEGIMLASAIMGEGVEAQ